MRGMVTTGWRRKLLFSAIALALIWLLTEAVLGITGWYKAPSERVYTDIYDVAYELLPRQPLRFGNANAIQDPTNHAGFRGPEFSDQKVPGLYRIISAGDSTTFGVMVPEAETYSRQLEKMLRAQYGANRIEVLNAGIPGTNIYTHRLLFSRKLVRYRPDAVILYLLFNSRNEFEVWRELEHKAARGEFDPVSMIHRVLRHSHLYRLLRRMIKGSERIEVLTHIEAIQRTIRRRDPFEMRWVLAGLREDLNGLIDAAEKNNVKLLIVHHLHRQLVREQVEKRKNPHLALSEMATSLDDYIRFSQKICEARGAAFINPIEPFVNAAARGEELFLDNVHFSPAGHLLMAQLLTKYMEEHAAYFRLPARAANAR
jgi:lysophospholipase L1-like esterase